MNITPLSSLSPDIVSRYRGLRREALRRIYAESPSTDSYQHIIAGLMPIEDFIRQTAQQTGRWSNTGLRPDETVEREIAAAAHVAPGRAVTISSLMDLAMYRRERTAEVFWTPFAAAGMQVQKIPDCFIPADKTAKQGAREHKNQNEVTFGPKTLQLLAALLEIGLVPADIFAYRGEVSPCGRRKVPYTLIEIPRLEKQIAVCDQMGQATFACRTLKPLSFWASNGKIALHADPDVIAIRYNAAWQERIRDFLLGKHVVYFNGSLHPKPPVSRRPQLTTATLTRWIETTRQQEKKYPTKDDTTMPVWDLDDTGHPVIVKGEGWPALDKAIKLGLRGLQEWTDASLSFFRKAQGLGGELRGGYANRSRKLRTQILG